MKYSLAAFAFAFALLGATPSFAGPPCRSDVGGLCGQDYNTWHNNWNRGRQATNRARQRIGMPLLPRTVEADDRRYGNGYVVGGYPIQQRRQGFGGYPVQQRRQGFVVGGLLGQLTGLNRRRGGYGSRGYGGLGSCGNGYGESQQASFQSQNFHREYSRQGVVQGPPVVTVNVEATAAANVDVPFPSTWDVRR